MSLYWKVFPVLLFSLSFLLLLSLSLSHPLHLSVVLSLALARGSIRWFFVVEFLATQKGGTNNGNESF
uniref:Putative secreted peptide n=1 Tax=Anopheles braziliensis TaxID=58242 RepID=A0A2M3ZN79_9DIPT